MRVFNAQAKRRGEAQRRSAEAKRGSEAQRRSTDAKRRNEVLDTEAGITRARIHLNPKLNRNFDKAIAKRREARFLFQI